MNDTFGHATGDTVLRQVGQVLKQTFPCEDVMARWGGEELVVGMYGKTRNEGLQQVVQLKETLHHQEFIASNGIKFQVTISVGIAQYPEDGTDLQSLYHSAEIALYQAKTTECAASSS